MSLRYALLGYLYDMSLSGYDLARLFDSSVGYFWNASHSQIYPELKKMKEEGLLASERVEQEDRPSKTVYTATGKGRKEFIRWMKEPDKLQVVRNAFLIKAYFLDRLDPNDAIEKLDERLRYRQNRLEFYTHVKEMAEQTIQGKKRPLEMETKILTVEQGIMYTKAEIEWCKHAKEVLRQHVKKKK